MKIIVACEFSGIVRDAFTERGHDTVSCDLLPTERLGKHIQGDALEILNDGWDMMIAHPPCTYLTVSGNKWFKPEYRDKYPDRLEQREHSIQFFMSLVDAKVDKICIENPIGIMSTKYRKPDQIIQPWQFGHGETKATCLWLKNLPRLEPTNIVSGREQRLHKLPPKKDRWKERSRTYTGIADAMATQWG